MNNPINIILGILGAISVATLICAIWGLISRDLSWKIIASAVILIIVIVTWRDMQQGEK